MRLVEAGKVCIGCKIHHIIDVPDAQFIQLLRWQMGDIKHIQDAVPDMSADDREILISGTCPKVFADLFGEEE